MRLKRPEDLEWSDLPNIEHPFFARSDIEWAFLDDDEPDRIWDLDDVLADLFDDLDPPPHWDPATLDLLLDEIDYGEVFLVHESGKRPFAPVVRWQADGESADRGRWVSNLSMTELPILRRRLEDILRRLNETPARRGSAPGSWWDKAVGGAKELGNRFAKANAAMNAEWLAERNIVAFRDRATGETLGPGAVRQRYETDGRDLLPPVGDGEADGARVVRDSAGAGAMLSAAMALATRFRSVVRHPDEFAADLKQILTHNTRSAPEALGKAGLEQAKRRLGHRSDPRYVDRYHGPDDMTKKDGRLAEWEAKGNNQDSTSVALDTKRNRQGSREKNLRRAQLMTRDKARKVGLPSNRQGGPYTAEEIDLWGEIDELGGDKQHISVHTNTDTGRVRVFERDHRGNIAQTLDEFELENFNELKQVIGEAFK